VPLEEKPHRLLDLPLDLLTALRDRQPQLLLLEILRRIESVRSEGVSRRSDRLRQAAAFPQ
jgi:hypothetical protein